MYEKKFKKKNKKYIYSKNVQIINYVKIYWITANRETFDSGVRK